MDLLTIPRTVVVLPVRLARASVDVALRALGVGESSAVRAERQRAAELHAEADQRVREAAEVREAGRRRAGEKRQQARRRAETRRRAANKQRETKARQAAERAEQREEFAHREAERVEERIDEVAQQAQLDQLGHEAEALEKRDEALTARTRRGGCTTLPSGPKSNARRPSGQNANRRPTGPLVARRTHARRRRRPSSASS